MAGQSAGGVVSRSRSVDLAEDRDRAFSQAGGGQAGIRAWSRNHSRSRADQEAREPAGSRQRRPLSMRGNRGGIKGLAYRAKHAVHVLGHRPGKGGPGRGTVPAAAELRGQPRQSSPLRDRNDTLTPPRACSMKNRPTSTPRRLTVKSTRSSESCGIAPVPPGRLARSWHRRPCRPCRSAIPTSVSPMSRSRPRVFRSKRWR